MIEMISVACYGIVVFRLAYSVLKGGRRGVVVTRLIQSAKLLYAGARLILRWVTACRQVNHLGM